VKNKGLRGKERKKGKEGMLWIKLREKLESKKLNEK